MGIYDINPGLCQDTISIVDKSGTAKHIKANNKPYIGTRIILASKSFNIGFTSCFQYKLDANRAFQLTLRKTGLNYNIEVNLSVMLDSANISIKNQKFKIT